MKEPDFLDFSALFEFAVGELGLKPCEFWELTYAEFVSMAEGYERKQKYEVDKLLFLSWHTEAFARQKRLPTLDKLLHKDDNPNKQTDDEIMATCKTITLALGGEVIENDNQFPKSNNG